MKTPKEEAVELFKLLFEALGTAGITRGIVPYVEARYGILEMKEKGFNWRENEWQGYHLKHMLRELCIDAQSSIQPFTYGKSYLVKGEHIWDIRNKASEEAMPAILFSNETLDKILSEHRGLGVLIADSVSTKDEDGVLLRWHEKLKGEETDYTRRRKAEGRPPREMKTAYIIRRLYAFHFSADDITTGFSEGWLKGNFQSYMRQFDGGKRGGKTTIDIPNVPVKHLLFVANFNEDRDEYNEEFGHPEWYEP